MTTIKTAIMQKLGETAQNYDVKIPLAIESGSRGWGLASYDSDYDCRFIYVHKKDWYLSLRDKKDVIEYAVDPVFDINGWDLKKALQHIVKSNTVMFEWLSSNEVYLKDEYITEKLKAVATDCFNPIAVSYHYLSIAKNKLAEIMTTDEAKLKQYFYILRPLANLNFIHQYGQMPYMEYERTLAATTLDPAILAEIQRLKAVKANANERLTIKHNPLLITYFDQEITRCSKRIKQLKFSSNYDLTKADSVFKEIIEWVWADESN